ncbi:N-(5'-phosphoribosyl)anthranilate isomerase [Sulfitobacter geojensis]|uniref:N-(5'-phosphoribosyl)anthranilate isomerase n=1 Tax=Sulfitobacter geojensis TaxID=1342299 RepID=A0AAE3B6H5_9RHOB|nr:N-(5'-phosphoribosyl)anthranilate isomerase [Sulfitobacter geojensis]MBM1689075.1 N-(5'-phosphoribosyl)anthranilate isomerase [Sulfitobacter geojensis]MBM1693142.1 N-(5'-phosphoribosyl)anthranilate isomerase [Sulfitobacter geojensis]MBM1705308.1 N-(5'-phosphoribosyl)anthranilate isomerase [Sulfitobacter geojensis]MBM1709366.1 N-(5'-phosphoribosyl)anthranilate isomerase [Sulfitobacter geojensis]MBM1713431.1 N-(5'-phosphoribosyl)anthranilate isomerase [Sulfitobacter geojensis]
MTPELWLRQLYGSKSALDGAVVRRKVADVDTIVGCPAFEADVRRRGFRAAQNGTMYVVFCNHEDLRLIE